jgi:hypothetical protein
LLLRCAATYHWDQLLHFLTVVEEIVASSIRDRDRIAQEQRIQAVYRQVTSTDQWGNTVLHEACYKSPPVRVIQALLTVCAQVSLPLSLFNREGKEEPRQVSLTHFLTQDWSTPLMVACGTGADLDILQLLLSAAQQEGGVDDSTTSCLVTVPDRRGCTPLSELVIHYELQRKSTLNRYSLQAMPLDEIGVGDIGQDHDGDSTNNELLSTFWAKTEALIRAAWVAQVNSTASTKKRSHCGGRHVEKDINTDDDAFQHLLRQSSWISLVHGAALGGIADSCPTVLTKLICRSYPAMIGFANRQGILPIHCATAFPIVVSPHDDSNCIIHHRCHDNYNYNANADTKGDDDYSMATILVTSMQRRCTWIETLIHWYPRSVQMNHFPHNHRSIFCQALASGLTWHVPLLSFIVLTIPRSDNTNSGGDDDFTHTGWADFSALPPPENNASSTSTPITSIVNEESTYPNYYTTVEHPRGQNHQLQKQRQQGPIQLLWKHDHPQILSTRDVVTGLYPFCLAALPIHNQTELDDDNMYKGEKVIHGNSTEKRKRKKRTGPRTASILSAYQLDTIYALLRLHPQLIQEAIR